MLLVRACLGEAFVAKDKCSGFLKPPECADKRGPLNSVVAEVQSRGGAVEHPEYIVVGSKEPWLHASLLLGCQTKVLLHLLIN